MYNQDPEKCGIWEEEGTMGRGGVPGNPDPTTELSV